MALTQAEFSDIVTTSVTDGNYIPDQFNKLLQDKIARKFKMISNQ